MENLLNDIQGYAIAVAGVVTAATAITMLTPTKVDDKILGKAAVAINFFLKVLNILAGNIAKNKNADAE